MASQKPRPRNTKKAIDRRLNPWLRSADKKVAGMGASAN